LLPDLTVSLASLVHTRFKNIDMADQKDACQCHFDMDHWRVGAITPQSSGPKPHSSDIAGQVAQAGLSTDVTQKCDVLLKVVERGPSGESEYDLDHWRIGPKISRAVGVK
jgi:hypothetical protein